MNELEEGGWKEAVPSSRVLGEMEKVSSWNGTQKTKLLKNRVVKVIFFWHLKKNWSILKSWIPPRKKLKEKPSHFHKQKTILLPSKRKQQEKQTPFPLSSTTSSLPPEGRQRPRRRRWRRRLMKKTGEIKLDLEKKKKKRKAERTKEEWNIIFVAEKLFVHRRRPCRSFLFPSRVLGLAGDVSRIMKMKIRSWWLWLCLKKREPHSLCKTTRGKNAVCKNGWDGVGLGI